MSDQTEGRRRPRQEKIARMSSIAMALFEEGNQAPNCKDIARQLFDNEKLHSKETDEVRALLGPVRKSILVETRICVVPVNKPFFDKPKGRNVESIEDAKKFIHGKPYGLYFPIETQDPLLSAYYLRRTNGAIGVTYGTIDGIVVAARDGKLPAVKIDQFVQELTAMIHARLNQQDELEEPEEEETPEE